MPSYSKLLEEYLSDLEKESFSKDYTKHDKNAELNPAINIILNDFYQTKLLNILITYFNVNFINALVLGSGTQGVVMSIKTNKSTNIHQAFIDLSKETSRHRGPYGSDFPEEIALKFQIISTDSSYTEKRMLREEYIMNHLNEPINKNDGPISIVQESIPKLYFGCTIKFNDTFFRLTFMELIKPFEYITIEKWLEKYTNIYIREDVYQNIKTLVESLWRLNISHNDLSIRNIMVGITKQNIGKVKLLDFGLSQLFNGKVSNAKEYSDTFASDSKDEQHGSNVDKLQELYHLLKNQ